MKIIRAIVEGDERNFKDRVIKNLKQRAAKFGFD
tara:strand:+ start:846 stop:947 length:102 start_codon:yes stop_codon:yes gene_type:complete